MATVERDAKIEVFIGRHENAWRVYVAGWIAPYVRQRLDEHGEAFPVTEPDLRGLDNFMFQLDAPYVKRVAANGNVEIAARGRSAVVFSEWLDGLLSSRPT